jgi:hypothetical protein
MLRSTYDWVMGLAARKDAVWVLAAIAFIESSVFPIPPDVLLIPMVLAARDSAWRYAAGLRHWVVGIRDHGAADRRILRRDGQVRRPPAQIQRMGRVDRFHRRHQPNSV